MLPIPVNVIPEYRTIQNGDIANAISSLEAKYESKIQELNKRLKDMTFVLHDANNMLKRLLELCGDSV